MKDLLPTPKHKEFLDLYLSLITSAVNENGSNTELHHILPRSMGGSNAKSNLVYLTTEQHYEAHYLLWKAYNNQQMSCAFHLMTTNRDDRRKLTVDEFVQLRNDYRNSKKEYWKSLSEEKRRQHRKNANPWSNKNDEEKEEYKKKLSDQTKQNSKQKWTDERRLEHSNRMKDWAKTQAFGSKSETRIQSYKKTVSNRTDEDRAKLNYGTGGARPGSIWINNGIENRRCITNEIPLGWIKGRIKKGTI